MLTRLPSDLRRRRVIARILQFRSRYAFRVRFELGARQRLSFQSKVLILSNAENVRIEASGDEPLNEAAKLLIVGRGYRSEDAANAAAGRWQGYVERGFARANVGADFVRGPGSGGVATEYGLANFSAMFPGMQVEPGTPLLNDFPRTVFKERPWPKFVRAAAEFTVGRNPNVVLGSIKRAASMELVMPERHALAYNLYSASFLEPSEDARFVMLMMAVETMIDLAPRSDEANQHVDSLLALTTASDLPENEIQSIVGVLEWLRRESIGQSGRRLARTLGERRYADESPSKFFTTCYEIRSGLVHGRFPRPSVDGRVASLERFVADLLSGDLLDAVDINALAADGQT